MKLISSLVLSFVIGGLLLIAMPHQAAAACKTDGSEIATSFAWGGKTCFPAKTKDGSINNPIFIALLTIFNFMAVGVGVLVTGGIIFGALQYITANGNAQKTQQGVTVIMNSVIGLLLFIFMWAILNYLVPGGLFRS